jgi:Zn-dependent membrane protease YugP
MFPFYINPYYIIFMAPAFILMLAAQWYVNSAYRKWSKVQTSRRMTGVEIAERLKRSGGLYDVQIEGVRGQLTDHYDPRRKMLRLSTGIADGSTVAAAAITAHEIGHAMQDHENYLPLRFRGALVPAVNIGSYLGWILLLLGMLLNYPQVAWIGVGVFGMGALFAVTTLPVEFNASARGLQALSETGIIVTEEERRGVKNVLNAAALTYVAALVTAILQLLYYASMVLGMGRRRR